MGKLIYVDTNVFISYLRGEYGNVLTVNQEYEGQKLFDRAIECEFIIAISRFTLKEFSNVTKLGQESIDNFFKRFAERNKLKLLEPTVDLNKRALEIARIYKTHYADAMHAAYAERENTVLVTWNIRDFSPIKEITAVRPNEL